VPRLPQVYSLTTMGSWIVPVVTKACKRRHDGTVNAQTVIGVGALIPVEIGQIVTLFVNLCV